MKGRTAEQQANPMAGLTDRLSGACAIATDLSGVRTTSAICASLASHLHQTIPYTRAWLVVTEGEDVLEFGATWSPDGPVEEYPVTEHFDERARANRIVRRLLLHDRDIGFLALELDPGFELDPITDQLLTSMGALVVTALGSVSRHDEGERRRKELTEIIEIGRSFAAVTNARDLCRAIAERAARLVGAESCFVATSHPRRNTVTAEPPGFGVRSEEIGEFRFPVDSSEGGIDALRWLEPFYSNSPESDIRFSSVITDAYRPLNLLCAPMRAKGETVGFLFAADRPAGFDHKTARLLGAIAPQAAAALSNAQLLEAAESRAQREALLNRITTSVRESLEIDAVLPNTVRLLGESLELDRCFVAFVDRTRRIVSVIHEFHVPEVASTVGEFPMASYGTALVNILERGEIVAVNEADRDERTEPFYEKILKPLGVRSLMYVPVPTEHRLWPVLGFSQVRRTRQWTDEEIEFARAVANQVAVAMRQAQLYDRERSEARNRALLNRINRAVRASLDVDTILETTVEELGTALQVDRCFVLAPGPFTATVESATVRFEFCKPGIASVMGLKVPVRNRAREGPVGMIEEPLAISDIAENPRLVSSRKAQLLTLTETRAMLSVRAIYGDQVLAILELNQCFEARVWTRDEIDLVGEVAAQLAVGIHNAMLFRRVVGSEQQWNTTINSMTDGLAILDQNGTVLRLNESLLRLCGLTSAQDAIGRHCYKLIYGEIDALRDGPVERVLSTCERVQIERDIPARGIALRESIDPIFDDEQKIVGLVLVVRDVTRERDTERAIRYRNRQLAALNAIASATIHAADQQAIIDGAFSRIMDVTGADAGVMLTLDDEGVRLDPVATHGGAARTAGLINRDPSSPTMSAVLSADVPLALDDFLPEMELGDNDGADATGTGLSSALYAPIRSQRRAVGLIVIAYEMHREFSANERQLLTVAGQQLGVAIENARLIANLQQALERVREANRLKDEFLATVSHELRTPLTAIQGWAEVLADPETNPDEAREGLATIQQSSESLTKLISDLLEMSRIETRMLRLDLHPIDPNYPIQAAVQTVRQMAEAKGVTIAVLLDRDLPHIIADSGRLQQVMWNLLVNAIKFTRGGGNVWVSSHMNGNDHIEIVVRDDGIGIDSDFLPFVFERFRQADGSATRQFGGLGIGLSLVKSLTEAHGGTVHAASPGPGDGATFTVSIPLMAQE